MPTLDQVDPSFLFCMFKGEPGLRKSTQALSFPKPQYWLSWDGHMDSLLVPMKKWGINPKDIEYDDYLDWDLPRKKLESLVNYCPYQTVIADSLTTKVDASLRQVLDSKSGNADKGKRIGGILVPGLEEYNAEAGAFNEFLDLCKKLKKRQNVNIILIAHVVQAEYRDTTNKTTHVCRQIVTASKKIAPKIPAICTEVYHFNLKKGMAATDTGEHTFLTVHTGDDFARTALDLPPEVVFGDNPIYDTYLLPKINELKHGQRPIEKPKVIAF